MAVAPWVVACTAVKRLALTTPVIFGPVRPLSRPKPSLTVLILSSLACFCALASKQRVFKVAHQRTRLGHHRRCAVPIGALSPRP